MPTPMHAYTRVHACIHTCMHPCMLACMLTRVHACLLVCMCARRVMGLGVCETAREWSDEDGRAGMAFLVSKSTHSPYIWLYTCVCTCRCTFTCPYMCHCRIARTSLRLVACGHCLQSLRHSAYASSRNSWERHVCTHVYIYVYAHVYTQFRGTVVVYTASLYPAHGTAGLGTGYTPNSCSCLRM